MYVVRFCYDVAPLDRNDAIALIEKEVEAARAQNLRARLLIPLTRGRSDPALEYELEVPTLEMLDRFRERGIDAKESVTHDWMRNFSELLEAPPAVTIYRVDEEESPDTRA